jgi:hypothetical protein
MSDSRWKAAAMESGPKGAFVQRVLNPIRSRLLPRYDVYLQFWGGPRLGRTVRAGVRLIVPSGSPVDAEMARGFDFVALQAPDNIAFVDEGTPTVLLPPPVFPLSDHSEPPATDLPANYYLTIFNPYGKVKGTDDLARIVDEAPLPIVWCHSSQTVDFDVPGGLTNHRRIIHVDDPSPAQLRYLYENCAAYLCFSKTEGFGWSIADALRYAPALVSRPVGILSDDRADRSLTVHVRGERWSADWCEVADEQLSRDRAALDWLSPRSFRSGLARLVHPEEEVELWP